MAELKRHMDVPKERVLGSEPRPAAAPKSELKGTPGSEDNHHKSR